MILRNGNMWNEPTDIRIVTTNAIVNSRGQLVMGRGAALEATQKYPGCNSIFGNLVTQYYKLNDKDWPYGILIHPSMTAPMLAIFQVKWHFKDKASLDLIAFSVGMLSAAAQTILVDKLISMNMPGTGYGSLHRDDVLPIIESLPDNVEVWQR